MRHLPFALQQASHHKIALLTALPPGELIAESSPPYAVERGDMSSLPYPAITGSLNFVVPAEMMAGSMLFHVTVSEGRSVGWGIPPAVKDTYDVYADVYLRQTLRLRSIMVGYAGPKSSSDPSPFFLNPPSFPADLLKTAAATLEMFPVQNKADCSNAGFVTCELPLDDAAGCSPNWEALIAKLIAQKVADGNRSDVIYYGLLPKDLPFRAAHNKVGCERDGMSAGRVAGSTNAETEGGAVMAHLIGHECGLLHAPGFPDSTNVDPSFPAYPPYDPIGTPKGSIGEYGGIPFGKGGYLFRPQYARDFMGSIYYAAWISLYHYGRLIENSRLDPVMTSDEITATQAAGIVKYGQDVYPRPMISIIGLLRSERVFEPTSVMRIETREMPSSAQSSGLTAELRDEVGAPISRSPLHMLRSWIDRGGCGCNERVRLATRFPCVMRALIPDVGRGALLAISDGARDLWSCAARGKKPHIADFGASVRDNRLAVTWNVEAEAKTSEVWFQWSADSGDTWNVLATGVAGNAVEFDASALPSGNVTLRLLAGDGFDTAISAHVCIQMPRRPLVVCILSPQDGESLAAGGALRLWAASAVDGVTATAVGKAQWLMDGEPVAEGLDTFLLAPRPGEHTLELKVTAAGLEGTASHRVVIVESPRAQSS